MKRNCFLALMLVAPFVINAQINDRALRNEKLLDQFNYKNEIIYKTVNGEKLDLILFLPKVKKYGKTPVMLYTHGGGWAKGDKYNILQPAFFETLKILTDSGIACASIEYRLTRLDTSTAFDCVVDCKDAGRFLVKNADKYGLDAMKIGLWGGSAGGHLSLMTALGIPKNFPGEADLKNFDPAYKCVASYFPLTTFLEPEVLKGSNFANPKRFIPMPGGLLEEKRDTAKLISPVEYLKKSSPPILLLHGNNDKVLSINNSLYMMEVAKEKGAPVEMLTVEAAGHSFQGENIKPSMSEINKISAKFIMKHLLK